MNQWKLEARSEPEGESQNWLTKQCVKLERKAQNVVQERANIAGWSGREPRCRAGVGPTTATRIEKRTSELKPQELRSQDGEEEMRPERKDLLKNEEKL